MARKHTTRSTASDRKSRERKKQNRYCAIPPVVERSFDPDVTLERAQLIRRSAKKWANGTVLHYHFLQSPKAWRGDPGAEKTAREAFQIWKDVGIGLDFREVDSPDEAEVRIGFLRGDGAWSYVGRDVLERGASDRTMNFGWDITAPGEIDTPIHEIGHTLGFPHEHQNPNAGIEWDEEAVYSYFAGFPNHWDRETTYYNVIRKISPDAVQGSKWDPDSIMHYAFEAGLIRKPVGYRDGLDPAPGLSERDRKWVKEFYPSLATKDYQKLKAFESVKLRLDPGNQANFLIEPQATRKYQFATFGTSDAVLVLFEDVKGELRYVTGEDDSGEARNARLEAKLFAGRSYVLRMRLYYRDRDGDFGLMMW
jgi:hypothetical protein